VWWGRCHGTVTTQKVDACTHIGQGGNGDKMGVYRGHQKTGGPGKRKEDKEAGAVRGTLGHNTRKSLVAAAKRGKGAVLQKEAKPRTVQPRIGRVKWAKDTRTGVQGGSGWGNIL